MLPDKENIIFETAAAFIHHTNYPVFLTGKAGTGKTTFLKHIRQHSNKNIAVVAPTGVAAINAGGVTIHSFFQLPFTPFIPLGNRGFSNAKDDPNDKHSLLGKIKLSAQRREVMQQLDLLIIDEISMVRCDVLDAMDHVLRYVRNRHSSPFGGVQVLYIGDMYQLPPVVKDTEWQLLREYYSDPFFFNSHVCSNNPPVFIELQKVYRQKDDQFIALLNKVRNNEMDEEGYLTLHSRFGSLHHSSAENVITLTTHNAIADDMNNAALQKIEEPIRSFKAEVNGEFYPSAYPAEELLQLKTGAQVMFIKNDVGSFRRYFNGKIGIIKAFKEDKIIVECREGTSVQEIETGRETWHNIQYVLNKQKNTVEEEILGTFTQYPLRLAWAITIHKSQGLTFEHVTIDAGQAFAPGQVYVALSRCTTLEGIVLKSRINMQSFFSDRRIVAFSQQQHSSTAQKQLLQDAMMSYQQELLLSIFDFKPCLQKCHAINEFIAEQHMDSHAMEWCNDLNGQMEAFEKHGRTFSHQMQNFFADGILPEHNESLKNRLKSAANWFTDQLDITKVLINKCPIVTDNRLTATDANKKIQSLFDDIHLKLSYYSSLKSGFTQLGIAEAKRSFTKHPMTFNAYSGKSTFVPKEVKHPALYIALKNLRDDICEEQGLATYMVCSQESLQQIANYLPNTLAKLGQIKGFGKHKLKQFGLDFLTIVKSYCEELHIENSEEEIPEKKANAKKAKPKQDTKLITYDLYKQGKSIAEIAGKRNFSVTTIEGHIAHFIEEGLLQAEDFIKKEQLELIIDAIQKNENATMSELKQLLPNNISFGDIKMAIASHKHNLKQLSN